ncbi:MAG: hypothetical protein GF364_14350 [Candidatus Lokiarchaeota archaeon]|nr:hypothetical protein [Candidatus Lokiarchaeota archaeon]
MSDTTLKYKRTPSKRCRIIDLINGPYDESDKSISTIFGNVRRARIYADLIYKKGEEQQESDESMIKSTSGSTNKLNFLIDDGTGKLWINLWGVNPEHYRDIEPGCLIHVVGTVKKKNTNDVIFYTDFITRIDNPNFQTLHELKMVEYIKDHGKEKVDTQASQSRSINEDDVDEFITSQEKAELQEQEPKIDENIDDFDLDPSDFDELELEDIVIETIKHNDVGDGVSLNDIIKKTNISKDVVEDIIKRLILNTKVYSTKNDNYKLHSQ